jgi:4-hydroxy-tetrahydrodipicolinate synthase
MSSFEGIFVATITPFDRNLEVDYEVLCSHVEFLVSRNVHGLVPCGTNGEFSSLTLNEAKKVIEETLNFSGKTTVVAGTGRPSIKETLELSRFAWDVGVDALIILPPYYFKASEEGLFQYYSRIFEEISETPIFLYNIPKYSNNEITHGLVKKLSKYPNLLGVKDSSGDDEHIKSLIKTFPSLKVFAGSDAQVYLVFSAGGVGQISAIANVFPEKALTIYEAFKKGDLKESFEKQKEFSEIRAILKEYPARGGLKYIYSLISGHKSFVRPPLLNLTEAQQEELKKRLQEKGLLDL